MIERTENERKIWTAGAVLLSAVAAVMILAWSSCSPWTQAARVTLASRMVGDEIDRAFATATREKTAECLKAHGSKTPGYNDCVREWRGHLERWRKLGRPGLSALVSGAFRSIQLGKMAKADPKDILPIALRAICGASEMAAEYGPLFPANVREGITRALAIAKGVTCK